MRSSQDWEMVSASCAKESWRRRWASSAAEVDGAGGGGLRRSRERLWWVGETGKVTTGRRRGSEPLSVILRCQVRGKGPEAETVVRARAML